jgi:hypothetical protein
MDARANFAFGTLAAGINSAATSLTVGSGEGSRFPAPPFNAVIWQRTDYSSPAEAYHAGHAEIVRVTAISTDTLTIARAQEGTTARNLNMGGKTYEIFAGPTARLFGIILGSSSNIVIIEDFLAVAAGENTWGFRSAGAAGGSNNWIPNTNGIPGSCGCAQLRTSTTSGAGGSNTLRANATGGTMVIDGTKRFQCQYLFCWEFAFSTPRTRIGFNDSGTVIVPDNFVGLRYDTDGAFADTTVKFECRAAGVSTVVDSGITPVINTSYLLKMWSNGDGIICFSINNGAEFTLSSGFPSSAISPGFTHANGSAVQHYLTVDWFRLVLEGVR